MSRTWNWLTVTHPDTKNDFLQYCAWAAIIGIPVCAVIQFLT